MKIAVFYPSNQFTAWSMAGGIGATLRRMGHTVVDVTMPTDKQASQQMIEMVRAEKPKLAELLTCDLIIISGPEHIAPWIDVCYTQAGWKKLHMPKAGWLHESLHRDDVIIDPEGFKWVADYFFFPAEQDADFQDQEHLLGGRSHWLPLGVDTEIFKPIRGDHGVYQEAFDIAFIGLLYPKRQLFMQQLARHNHPPIRMGQVGISDLHGYDHEGSARRLASNYRQIKVFLNLPSLSRMLVSKVVEILSCGTFLLTPTLPDEGKKNMEPFKSGEHLVYYSPSNVPYLAQLLRDWSLPEKDAQRAKVAEQGCREVHAKHSLDVRLQEMLAVFERASTYCNAGTQEQDLRPS